MSKLLEEVRDLIRILHYSNRTEEAYLNWIRQGECGVPWMHDY